MEIGPYIKLHRIKQEMTQAELAEGIVSYAYLSKIENQKTEASPNVISLLCTRLGIQLNNETDETIREKCQEWYGMLFDVNDKEEIIKRYRELNDLMYEHHSDNLVMFEIHKVRYFLVIGKTEEALNQINKLSEMSSTFDSLHLFYWYKFKGNYSSLTGEYSQALRAYKLAEEKLNQLELSEDAIADIQYVIAVTHSKLRNTLEAIDYAEKAIDTFRKQYNFVRCAQCHNLLGISFRRIRMYDKAIKHFHLALHLGKLNKNKQLIQLTNQNLGYLYSTKGESKEAIKHYTEIIYDEDVVLVERLAAIASLIKEYHEISNYEEARKVIDYGLTLIDQFPDSSEFILFNYVIHTYHYSLNRDYDKLETLLIDHFIPYLKQHKDFANIVVYANLLAKHYEQFKKYKDAAKYYKIANLAYEQIAVI